MIFAPEVLKVATALVHGLPLEIEHSASSIPYVVAANLAQLSVHEGYVQTTGDAQYLAGPSVRHIFRARSAMPGVELDLLISNGDIQHPGPHLPGLPIVRLTPPKGWRVVSRVSHQLCAKAGGGHSYTVELRTPLLQGSLAVAMLALVPESLPVEAVDKFLASPPWLASASPAWYDHLPRSIGVPATLRKEAADLAMALLNGGTPGEYGYLAAAYGGVGSGDGIRFDWGAEFDGAISPGQLYQLSHRLDWEIRRRPQRAFLTKGGAPLQREDKPAGLKLVLDPSLPRMFPQGQAWPGFDETSPLLSGVKNSIDLQHAIRWLAPMLFAAQRFGCPTAYELIRWYAAACRVSNAVLAGKGKAGTLGRADAWCAEVQAADWRFNGTLEARDWLSEFVAECGAAQTKWGGLCAWTTDNKEAEVYAKQYLASLTNPMVDYTSLPTIPVSQPYQEVMLNRALWLAAIAGVGSVSVPGSADPMGPEDIARKQATFICQVAREPGHGAPIYRVGIDGKRLDKGDDGYLWPETITIARALGMVTADWLAAATGGAPDPLAKLKQGGVLAWRNRWHLIGQLEALAAGGDAAAA